MSDGNNSLPDGWIVASIDSFARTATGGTPSRKRKDYYGGDIPWVKSGDLKDSFVTSVHEMITQQGLHTSNAKIFPKGTVCVALYGATVGKLGILDIDAATNQAVCGIFPDDGIEPKYLFHALREKRNDLIAQAKGGAQPNISNGVVKQTKLRIAPLTEQHRIVAKIESLQGRSSRARAALAEVGPLLEQFRRSVLCAAFSGRLTADWRAANPDVEPASELLNRIRTERRHRWEQAELAKYEAKGKKPSKGWKDKYKKPAPAEASGLPDLPNGWCWARWEEVGFCQNGRAFPSKHYTDSGIRLLRPGNLHASGYVNWSEDNTRYMPAASGTKHPAFIVEGNELVMNLTAQSLKDEFLGRVCLTGPGDRCLLNQRIARITPITPLDPKFCMLLFKSHLFRRYVDTLNTGSLIQHMFTSQVSDFLFPLPPSREHAVIAEMIQASLARKDAIRNIITDSLAELAHLDQSILATAFRGELVPQDPSDEPASELLARIRTAREQERKPKAKKPGRKSAV